MMLLLVMRVMLSMMREGRRCGGGSAAVPLRPGLNFVIGLG